MATPLRSSKRKRAEVRYDESSGNDYGEHGHVDSIQEDYTLLSRKRPAAPSRKEGISQKPLPRKEVFPFALLPPELRNKIYELTLLSPTSILLGYEKISHGRIAVRVTHHHEPDCPPNRPLCPAILLLNKKLRAEAQPILYNSNHFIFEKSRCFHAFLANIGTKNVSNLTELTLRFHQHEVMYGFTETYAMLIPAVGLQIFNFVSIASRPYKELSYFALRFYHMARTWLEARGEAAFHALRFHGVKLQEGRQRPMNKEFAEVLMSELRMWVKHYEAL